MRDKAIENDLKGNRLMSNEHLHGHRWTFIHLYIIYIFISTSSIGASLECLTS